MNIPEAIDHTKLFIGSEAKALDLVRSAFYATVLSSHTIDQIKSLSKQDPLLKKFEIEDLVDNMSAQKD
jgi:hypothetical protein